MNQLLREGKSPITHRPIGLWVPTRSLLSGGPLIVVVTDSDNRKTGPMLQSWILRSDLDPVSASRAAADGAICGTCPHRHSLGGACYVVIGRAPNAVYDAWRRGRYAFPESPSGQALIRAWRGRPLRVGAYGDPAAVSRELWAHLFSLLQPKLWTGYTHLWTMPHAATYRDLCCASVDTPGQYQAARAAGWRPFRTRRRGEPLLPGEFECPAGEEQGRRLTCDQCGACNGNPHAKPRVGSAAIYLHGFKIRAQAPAGES